MPLLHRRPARPGKFPVIPFLLGCLGLLAALLCWKGALYAEAVALRQFLDRPAPAAALEWWAVAGVCAIGVVLGIARKWRGK
jgi:hypothetical protein